MISVKFDTSDCGEFYKNYSDIELKLRGSEYHAAYITDMFRSFMLAMGFHPNTVDYYIRDVDGVDSHIENRIAEKLEELSEKNAKVSGESTDNSTSSKNKKPVKEWDIEDWRAEFKSWMKEKGVWDAYEKACRDNEDSGRMDFEEINNPIDFTCNAFTWGEHTDYLSSEEWGELDTEWIRYVRSLKEEN